MILNTSLTPALEAWLAAAHDPGEPPLLVSGVTERVKVVPYVPSESDGPAVRVLRRDGSEPSEREHREIVALLAAHAVEPLSPPKQG